MEKPTADTQTTATSMEAIVQDDRARALLAAHATARTAYNGKLDEIRELHRNGEPNVPAIVDKDLRPLAEKYL